MMISISGYAGSGKDTVGLIIQYLNSECSKVEGDHYRTFEEFVKKRSGNNDFNNWYYSDWKIKRWADKLKVTASIISGIPIHKFEDQEFKKTQLGPEWSSLRQKPGKREDGLFPKNVEMEMVPMTVRELLQKLGTDAVRNGLHDNTWVNALMADYQTIDKGPYLHDSSFTNPNAYYHTHCRECDKEYIGYKRQYICESCIRFGPANYPDWIITDTRFPNEAAAVKSKNGVLIRVVRPGTIPVNSHPSETALDDYPFDFIIDNSGNILDLIEQVRSMLNIINKTA